jgi:hypothetical protein
MLGLPMAASPPADATAPHDARRRRWPVWLGLGLLASAIGVRVALPELLRRTIESQASQALGRKVELADVDLGLLAGRVSLEGLKIGGADLAAPVEPQSAVIGLAHLGAKLDWLPLLSGKIRLEEIALAEPMLRLERTLEGGIAPLVLAASAPEPEPAEPETETEEGGGLDLAIAKLSLDGALLRFVRQRDADPIAELRFENLTLGDLGYRADTIGVGDVALRGPDLWVSSERFSEPAATPAVAAPPPSAAPPAPEPKSAPAKHHVEDLDIENARFAWRLPGGEAVQAELDIHASKVGLGKELFPLEIRLTTDQSVWHLKGQLAVEPVTFDGRFEWQGVRLPRLVLLVEDAPVKLAAGTTDGALDIALRLAEDDPAAPPSLRLTGDASLSGLDLTTSDGAAKLRWKKLEAALASLELPLGGGAGAPAVHLAKLSLQQPELEYQLAPAPSADAAPAEPAAQEPAAAAPAGEPAPAPTLVLDALELDGGSLRFRDTSVRPAVDTALRELRVRAQGVRWPERDVEKLTLSAKGQRAASLKLAGGVVGGKGGFDLALAELPLAPFDAYAAAASGLQIRQGRLSLDSKITLGPKHVGARSRLALHQLAIDERESGWFQRAFGVPLDVALALLRDLEGDITLPVDVEQDAGGTRVGIAAAVTAALRQALVGALASPLKLLGSVSGQAGSPLGSGLEPIPMEPGAEALSPAAHERVAALAQLLGSRPGLRVQLVGRADAQDDPLLARREVMARARADQPLPGEDELGFFERRRVRRALAEADPAQPELEPEIAQALERLAGGVQVTEAARQELALARAQAVAQALAQEHGAAAEAVAAIETEVGAPSVEVELRAE